MRWLCLTLGLTLCGACAAEEDGHPPVARIAIEPRAIPERDDFTTDVVLDGRDSADPIDDPAGTAPLAYLWEVSDDAARFQPGAETQAVVTVRFAGLRPARIALTVVDPDGRDATAVERMELTIR